MRSATRGLMGAHRTTSTEQLLALAFADDLAAIAPTAADLQCTVQALVAAMGAIGVRFNAKKSFYAWSPAAEGRGRPAPLCVCSLDAAGRWAKATLTSVPPTGDADARDAAGRGAARYLGIHFSFCGCDGDRWHEQRRIEQSIIASFFGTARLLKPNYPISFWKHLLRYSP